MKRVNSFGQFVFFEKAEAYLPLNQEMAYGSFRSEKPRQNRLLHLNHWVKIA
jgi:hypothetical protein